MDIELPFTGAAFVEAWNLFVQHRKESRHKLTPTATKLLLKKLAGWDEQRATAALLHSTENGWRGVFEPQRGNHEASKRNDRFGPS